MDGGTGNDRGRTDPIASGSVQSPHPRLSAPSEGKSVPPDGAGNDLGLSSDDLLLLEAARELRSAVNTILAVRGVLNRYDRLYGFDVDTLLDEIRQIVGC